LVADYKYSPRGIVYFEILEWYAARKKWTIPNLARIDNCFESIVSSLHQTSLPLQQAETQRRKQEAKHEEGTAPIIQPIYDSEH
jgi:hypothetical protein